MTAREDTIKRIEMVLDLTHKNSLTVTIPRLTAGRAVAMLKEQEPRVMTLGEIFTAQKKDTWYETRDEETIHPLMLVETENSIKNQCAYFWPRIVAPIKGYCKTWRCWTARPTDEQKKAVKWE